MTMMTMMTSMHAEGGACRLVDVAVGPELAQRTPLILRGQPDRLAALV